MLNLRNRWFYAAALLLILAVSIFLEYTYPQESALHAMPSGFKKFSLDDPPPKCARWKDHMPASREPVAYRIYIEARKVWRSKIAWQFTREEATRILTDVKRAADLGDWGARALMSHFYLQGLGVLDSNHVLDAAPEKSVEIARLAAAAMQPWGLYDLGVAYEHGYGGAQYNIELAWAYYLKAAQLGSPEAQMALAQAYSEAGRGGDEVTMLECAYHQEHGPAAYKLAIKAAVNERYNEGIRICQTGVKFGSSECARSLEIMFNLGYWNRDSDNEKEALGLLGIGVDVDREKRYCAIYDALEINPDLKFKKLDTVLPLPPAKLPAWSGIEDAIEPESNAPPTY